MAMPARATFAVVSLHVILTVTLLALAASGCSKSNFTGKSNKKIDSTPEKTESTGEDLGNSQTVTPTQTQPAQSNPIVVPEEQLPAGNDDVVVPNVDVGTSTSTLPASGGGGDVLPAQPVQPVQPVTPVTPEQTNTEGVALVPLQACYSNMENGYHLTGEAGNAFQIKDDQGVLYAGDATIEAVRNGRPTDGSGAYPGIELALDVTYAREVKDGSGTLSIGSGDPNQPAQSRTLSGKQGQFGEGDGERPTSIIDQPATWSASKDAAGKIQVKVSGDFKGATHHPVWAFAKAGACFKDFQSPIVLDLNNNGRLDLVDVWNEAKPVRFDLTGKGQTVRTGWVTPADGLLALDLNGNGKIDNGSELFGEWSVAGTEVAKLPGDRTHEHGYAALARYDDNLDGKIDATDKVFAKLLVWKDMNTDGVSQAKELLSLGTAGVKSLSLAYVKAGNNEPLLVQNNEVRLIATWTDGKGQEHFAGDVWFRQRRFDGEVAAASVKSH